MSTGGANQAGQPVAPYRYCTDVITAEDHGEGLVFPATIQNYAE